MNEDRTAALLAERAYLTQELGAAQRAVTVLREAVRGRDLARRRFIEALRGKTYGAEVLLMFVNCFGDVKHG